MVHFTLQLQVDTHKKSINYKRQRSRTNELRKAAFDGIKSQTTTAHLVPGVKLQQEREKFQAVRK